MPSVFPSAGADDGAGVAVIEQSKPTDILTIDSKPEMDFEIDPGTLDGDLIDSDNNPKHLSESLVVAEKIDFQLLALSADEGAGEISVSAIEAKDFAIDTDSLDGELSDSDANSTNLLELPTPSEEIDCQSRSLSADEGAGEIPASAREGKDFVIETDRLRGELSDSDTNSTNLLELPTSSEEIDCQRRSLSADEGAEETPASGREVKVFAIETDRLRGETSDSEANSANLLELPTVSEETNCQLRALSADEGAGETPAAAREVSDFAKDTESWHGEFIDSDASFTNLLEPPTASEEIDCQSQALSADQGAGETQASAREAEDFAISTDSLQGELSDSDASSTNLLEPTAVAEEIDCLLRVLGADEGAGVTPASAREDNLRIQKITEDDGAGTAISVPRSWPSNHSRSFSTPVPIFTRWDEAAGTTSFATRSLTRDASLPSFPAFLSVVDVRDQLYTECQADNREESERTLSRPCSPQASEVTLSRPCSPRSSRCAETDDEEGLLSGSADAQAADILSPFPGVELDVIDDGSDEDGVAPSAEMMVLHLLRQRSSSAVLPPPHLDDGPSAERGELIGEEMSDGEQPDGEEVNSASAELLPTEVLIAYAELVSEDATPKSITASWPEAVISLVNEEGDNGFAQAVAVLSDEAERLLEELIDSNSTVRSAAVWELGVMKKGAAACVGTLAAMTCDDEVSVRAAAVWAVGQTGSAAALELHVLGNALRDREVQVRARAAGALGALGNAADAEMSLLVAAFVDPDQWVRMEAVTALGCMGEAAKPSHVAALATALEERDPRMRIAVVKAFASLSAAGAFAIVAPHAPKLAALLKDGNAQVRMEVIRALGSIGPLATEQVPTIAVLLRDRDMHVRAETALVLGKFGLEAAPHAECLASLLRDSSADVRMRAADVFRTLGPAGQPHAAVLAEALVDPDPRVKRAAARGLCALGAASIPHVMALKDLLSDDDMQVRACIGELFGNLGKEIVPVLADRIATFKEDFCLRMASMRGLSYAQLLPPDLICAFLAEWIYHPAPEDMPIHGLDIVKIQKPQELRGWNMQWAVLRDQEGTVFVVFRGSAAAFDWTENSHLSLQRLDCEDRWGTLLLHGGFWSAVDNERSLLREALTSAAGDDAAGRIRKLTICGGSKGGASALTTAVLLLAPRPGRPHVQFDKLVVTTFGAPNIAGRGSGVEGDAWRALEQIRAALRRLGGEHSKAWIFREDPVVALLSHRSRDVLKYYEHKTRFLRWFVPSALNRARAYLEGAAGLAETFEPLLSEVRALPPGTAKGSRGDGFDASIHVQFYYTAALCRMLLDGSLSY